MHRQPVFYLTHGAGPCFWVTLPPPFDPFSYGALRTYFEGILASLYERPSTVLIVSAHWEEAVPTISTARMPKMLYDYVGFPVEAYRLQHAASGSPEVARRAEALFEQSDIAYAVNDHRGFDHGVFVPMKIIDPDANLPIVMLSLRRDLDAAAHLAIGNALAPLRDEGVLIIGSGSSYHNLSNIFHGDGQASIEFDAWLAETVTSNERIRNVRLLDWETAPGARASHPRAEHLMPLFIAAGSAAEDVGRRTFTGMIAGRAYSCFAFG